MSDEQSQDAEVWLHVKIPPALKRRAKAQAALDGTTLKDVVRGLLGGWLAAPRGDR